MRKGWTEATLGDLTATTRPICYGVLKPGPYVENGIPLVRITDMNCSLLGPEGMHRISPELDYEFRRSKLKGNEVLLSIQGTVGRIARCAPELAGANISRTIALIDCDKRVMNEFIAFYLETLAVKNAFNSSGSTRDSLNISEIRQINVPVPPIEEQGRIVDVVSSIDNYIFSLQKYSDAARAARNAVLRELIVAPSNHRKKLEDFVFLKRGHDLPTQSRVDGEYPVIASNGIVGWHNEQIGPVPGVITGRSGTIGKVVFVTDGYWPLNTTLYVTEFMGNDERFVALTLETMHLESFAGGTTVPSLDRKVLRSELVFAPPIEDQKRIVEIVSSMDEVIQSTEKAVVDAKALRTGLLSDLLSGNHEIPASYDSLLGAA